MYKRQSPFSVNVDEDDLCYALGTVSTHVSDCHETPLVSPCMDVLVVESTSPDFIAHVSPDHVDILLASPLPSLPSPSLECHSLIVTDYHDALKEKVSDCIGSLGTFERYDPPLDPLHDYLVDMSTKKKIFLVFLGWFFYYVGQL